MKNFIKRFKTLIYALIAGLLCMPAAAGLIASFWMITVPIGLVGAYFAGELGFLLTMVLQTYIAGVLLSYDN